MKKEGDTKGINCLKSVLKRDLQLSLMLRLGFTPRWVPRNGFFALADTIGVHKRFYALASEQLSRKTVKPLESRKTFLIDTYKYMMEKSSVVLFVHYNNLSKTEDHHFRFRIKQTGGKLTKVRNNLFEVYLRNSHLPDPCGPAKRKEQNRKHPLLPLLKGPTAVSYTHLDVYKRQGIVSRLGMKESLDVAGFLRPHIDRVLDRVPAAEDKIRKLVFAQRTRNNLTIGVSLYFLHGLFAIFSMNTVLMMTTILLYTVPLIYDRKQARIDRAIDRVKNMLVHLSLIHI